MTRVRIILQQGRAAPFPPFDRYAMYEASKGKSMSDLLQTFASLRAKNLDDLHALKLTSQQLESPGIHPQFGPVTLKNLLATWVVHDLGHLHQIAKSMAYQYREEVGSWREYLSILPTT
jgi:DinB superfamily